MDRISPSTLRLVVLALGAAAAAGLWMGLNDSLRRDAPDWESGRSEVPAAVAGPPEAVPIDAGKMDRALAAPPPAKIPAVRPAPAETAKEEAPPPATEDAPPIVGPAVTPPEKAPPPKVAAPPAKTPPAKGPAPKAPTRPSAPPAEPPREKASPAAPPPPEVPF